jgi:hypothetical protein
MRKLSHPVCVFDRFTFDPTPGCLLCGQEEIKLRPKSFEVLKYLIENNGAIYQQGRIDSVRLGGDGQPRTQFATRSSRRRGQKDGFETAITQSEMRTAQSNFNR